MDKEIVIDDIRYHDWLRSCSTCGANRVTRKIHGHLTFVCGNRSWPAQVETSCEGTKYLKYIVDKVIPEPQEP